MQLVAYELALDTPPNWAPLEQLAALCSQRAALPPIVPVDFMHMGCLRAPGRADVHLYKHIESRRYLPLDAAGHAYEIARHRPKRSLRAETETPSAWFTCQPYPDLPTALAAVLTGVPGPVTLPAYPFPARHDRQLGTGKRCSGGFSQPSAH